MGGHAIAFCQDLPKVPYSSYCEITVVGLIVCCIKEYCGPAGIMHWLRYCIFMSLNLWNYNHEVIISLHEEASIPVRRWIKEAARMDNLVIPQRAGWITSYPPIVNGYIT